MDSGKIKPSHVFSERDVSVWWCRHIVRVCYTAIGINFAVLVAIWYFLALPNVTVPPVIYWRRFIVFPTLCMLAANICADILIRSHRLRQQAKEYTTLMLIVLFCFFLCMVHSIVAVLLTTFVVPVFISTIFADVKLTRRVFELSQALQILSGFKMRFFSTRDFGLWIWVELIVSAGILSASYLMARIQISNGQFNIRSLERFYSERKSLKEQLLRDALTGLYNRKGYERFATELVEECAASGTSLSFIMLDVDDFKRINDTFGHAAGDAVLQCVARILRGNSNGNILAFRLGGEEFGLLLKGCCLPEAHRICEGMRSLMESSRLPEIKNTQVTFSCGIACIDRKCADLISLYKAADSAMYRAKSDGKNCIVLCDEQTPHAHPQENGK